MANTNGPTATGQKQYTQPSGSSLSDAQIGQILAQKSILQTQQIYSKTITPVSGNVIDVSPQAVGILLRFWVEVTATLNNTSGSEIASLTDGGAANLISLVRLYDTNNILRHDTNSLHLALVASAKRRHPFAGTADWNQVNGNNISQLLNVKPASWGVIQAPATIAPNGNATVRAVYEIPVAAAHEDLRGAIFANSVNSTMNLHLEFNNGAFVDTGANPNQDDTFAVYNAAPGTFSSAQVTIYQEFYSQLPMSGGKYLLPQASLSMAYQLNKSSYGGIVANADNAIPYLNFRKYLSSFVAYNSTGYKGGRNFGSDLNYIQEIAANQTPFFKYGPLFAAYRARETFVSDLPAGFYYLPHRGKPVFTTQTGNRQITLNPSAAGAAAYMWWANEFLADMSVTQGAASAP